jgi:molybdenum cofactor cytidylyltransferase
VVARVLLHPEGGRKGVPPHARVSVVINKLDNASARAAARETADRLLRDAAIASVVLAALRRDEPVLEIRTRNAPRRTV